jgi:hypothetical protein
MLVHYSAILILEKNWGKIRDGFLFPDKTAREISYFYCARFEFSDKKTRLFRGLPKKSCSFRVFRKKLLVSCFPEKMLVSGFKGKIASFGSYGKNCSFWLPSSSIWLNMVK